VKTARAFALFDTAVGRCGIAWGDRGVVGVQLPEANAAATRARVRSRFGDAREAPLPRAVKAAVADIVALLRGEKRDLSKIALDMDGVPEFHQRVYVAARAIPPGTTLTYGEIARRLGEPGAARAVGQALGRNPFAIVVPCHRVLAAGGKSGGFSAVGGVDTKLRMLAIEGARATEPRADQKGLFDAETGYGFDPRVALAHVRASDPRMAALIDAKGPFALELKSTSSVFVALAEAIVYQQLSVKAAGTIFGRVCALFPRGRGGPKPEHVLRATDASLRGAGLSNAKMLALQDLARRTISGEVPKLAALRKMDDAAIVESLSAVRGIGRWTAEMFLIFRLGRPDVLPVDDYGIRKGFAIALGKRALPTPKAVLAYGERWRPYRTLASWYLWRALEPDPD
jgi:methylated-DNA-[protein]-cysteine S-methyltransferase